MRRVMAMVSAAAFVLATTSVYAQGAAASFNGKWTRDMPAGGGGGAAGGGGGGGRGGGGRGGFGGGGGFQCNPSCTLTVTAANLKLERPAGQDGTVPPALNFKLDGSDSSNPGRMGQDGTPGPAVISKAKWDGNKIVISTTRDFQGQSITSTQTLSVEGGKLTVVTTSSMEGAQPQTATYTKG
ncbi:MAG TPA: hypothetical protein VFV78_07885 [Vicinamibacterales bacterium]|nr:hypothetical protein [Vicinamibacterales bacterium]